MTSSTAMLKKSYFYAAHLSLSAINYHSIFLSQVEVANNSALLVSLNVGDISLKKGDKKLDITCIAARNMGL